MLCSSLAFGQYEEESEPYIEGFVGVNGTLPMGYLKNDLLVSGADLNAKPGVGLDVGAGYHFTNSLIAGLYFSARNMGVEDFEEFHHRVFEAGVFGKYRFLDMSEKSWSPYLRVSVGLNFSKLATRVMDGSRYIYRELSYKPTAGTSAGLGMYLKLNNRGGVYAEGVYHYDMMKGVGGDFKGVDYNWGDKNQYVVLGAGVVFNIGPKE
jgi:hypothetical protein